MVFVDTPGLHYGYKSLLNRYMNKQARHALLGVDLILWMVVAGKWTEEDAAIAEILKQEQGDIPVILLLNKVDRVSDKEKLLPFITECQEKTNVKQIIPISAQTGAQVDELLDICKQALPQQEYLFPADMVTDRNDAFMATEFLRERLMRFLGDELPYSLTVTIELMEERDNTLHIHAIIWVEKVSQKGIVIGRNGSVLKKVSTETRVALEQLFSRKIFLRAWVKVKPGWSDKALDLRGLGYNS